jgi:hypothetical protein
MGHRKFMRMQVQNSSEKHRQAILTRSLFTPIDRSSPGSLWRPWNFRQNRHDIFMKLATRAVGKRLQHLFFCLRGISWPAMKLWLCLGQMLGMGQSISKCKSGPMQSIQPLPLQLSNWWPSCCWSMQLCQKEKSLAHLHKSPRQWAPAKTRQWHIQSTLAFLYLWPCHPTLGNGSSRTKARGIDADPGEVCHGCSGITWQMPMFPVYLLRSYLLWPSKLRQWSQWPPKFFQDDCPCNERSSRVKFKVWALALWLLLSTDAEKVLWLQNDSSCLLVLLLDEIHLRSSNLD